MGNRMKDPHEHASAAGAPGASGPGDPAYDGEVTLADEGGAAGAESFVDPNASLEEAEEAVTPEVRARWAQADERSTPASPG